MENEVVTTGSSLITSALADVSTVFTAALNMITSNPIAMVFIGFGLIGGGISLFRKLRKKA